MPDVTIAFNGRTIRGDFVLTATDLQTGDDLQTSIVVSLFTAPGWWANAYEPDAWGCRLLELRRAKHTRETLLRARDYCRAALRWLIEDRVADAVDVATEWQNDRLAVGITVTQASRISQYSFVWDAV